MDIKTFPIVVPADLLDRVGKVLKDKETKHEFIVKAVQEKLQGRENK